MDIEEGASSDPKYKQFNDDLNSVLLAFQKSAEWADFIKCLVKFAKVFEKYPKSTCIQPKLMIAKRLSQCLNPSLPSGCHSQALDTYELIFARIGQEKLAKDMAIYATGLFPLFHLASTDVRFKVLKMYERHFLPLGSRLHACLTGIVSSLLPGLEEGQGEIYEACKRLLDSFCKATSTTLFYQAIWKSLIITPYNRQAAINFLLTHLPKDFDQTDQLFYLPEKDTLVAMAIHEALSDHNSLVQRNMLELITSVFPISNKIFSEESLENIIKAAVTVVTHKDMSLNRRLYTWLLGPQEKNHDVNMDYFNKYSKKPTVCAFQEEFQIILDDVLLVVLRCLYRYKDGFPFSKDLIHKTDELLDSVADSKALWKFLNNLLVFNRQEDVATALEKVKLVECVLDIIPLSVQDVQTSHLPELLLSIIRSLRPVLDARDNSLIVAYTSICLRIIGKVIVDQTNLQQALVQSIETYQDYFVLLCTHVAENLPASAVPVGCPISLSTNNINTLSNDTPISSFSSFAYTTNSDIFIVLDLSLQVLVGLFQQFRTSPASPTSSPQLESSMPKWFFPIYSFCTSDNPFITCLAIKSFISLANKQGESSLSRSFRNIITNNHFSSLAKKLWSLLDPNNCAVHYKVASLFLALREMNEEACSSVIAEAMLDTNLNNRIEGYQKFALFWRLTGELGSNSMPFSNTLFLMLDSLHDEQPIIRLTGHTWLADSISKAERILDPLLKILLDKSTIRFNNSYQAMYDARRVIYAFKILKAIIECDFKLFIQHVIEKPISKDIIALNEAQTLSYRESPKLPTAVTAARGEHVASFLSFSAGTPQPPSTTETSSDFLFIQTNSYIDLLVVVALRFLQGSVPASIDHSTREGQSFAAQNDVVQICAAEFLQYLLAQTAIQPTKAIEIATAIQEPILQNLAQAVSTCNMVLQVHLLALLRSIVLIDSSLSSPAHIVSTLPSTPVLNPPQSPNAESVGTTSSASITQSPMFLQTTIVGLIQPSSRFNIRFYWLDFITFCLPRMAHSTQLPHVVLTIVNCLRDLLMSFDYRSLYDSLTSRDIIVLLKSLTYILRFSILEPIAPFDRSTSEEPQSNRGALGVRMITDFVKDVFTSEIDNSTTLTPIGRVRDELFKDLAGIIAPLLRVWGPPKSTSNKISISTDVSSDTHNKFAIQDLVIHILDPFFAKYPSQFVGALVDIWQRPDLQSEGNTRKVAMEVLYSMESVREDSLFASAHQILLSIHHQERGKPAKSIIHKLTIRESALYELIFKYVDEYATPFDGISPAFLAFVRESLHSSNPMTFVSQLQILNLYIRKMVAEEKSKTPAKYRVSKRDLQDLIPKIVEACFMISGKSFNDISAMYIPHSAAGDNGSQNTSSGGRPTSIDLKNESSLLPASILQTPPSAYTSAGTSVGEEALQIPANQGSRGRSSSGGDHDSYPNILKKEASRLKTQVSLKSLVHLSTTLAYLLDTIFDDKERIAALLANSLHNKDALELFFDSDFFKMDIKSLEQSSKFINQVMIHDKTALSDFMKIIGKTWAPSSLMFVNKESEYLGRAKQLKRLSFLIWSGVENQYLSILPIVQEKIVESLKIPNANVLHLQVFMCLRVLLLRITHENLRSFWPIILTELIDILSHAENSELVLASCKFLDLALTIPPVTEQFSLFEWVFIKDCFLEHQETPFKPFVDRISQNPVVFSETYPLTTLTASGVIESDHTQLLRPCIMIRSISDLPNGYAEFKSFLTKFSSSIYKRHLSANQVDYTFINEHLCFDFCELDSSKLNLSSEWTSLSMSSSIIGNVITRHSLDNVPLTITPETSSTNTTPQLDSITMENPQWLRTHVNSLPGGKSPNSFLEKPRSPALISVSESSFESQEQQQPLHTSPPKTVPHQSR
eukprot:gene19050-22806_t